MLKNLTVIFSILMLSSSCSKRGSYDSSHLFVKTAHGDLPHDPLIQESKELFKNLHLVKTANPEALKKKLLEFKNITYVKRNYYLKKNEITPVKEALIEEAEVITPLPNLVWEFNDPQIKKQWHLLNVDKNGSSIIEAYKNFPINQKKDITVAVIDTGIDYKHEDLLGQFWINSNEIPNNGIDDDQNGYVDDIHGISTINRDSQGRPQGEPLQANFHGTHVAGTIAAKQDNEKGIFGIASHAKIMALDTVPSDNTDETDADLIESLLYAAKNGARLINGSFGKDETDDGTVVNDTINHIGKTFDCLTLVAAGNEFKRDIDIDPAYPASFDSPYLVVVASTSRFNKFSRFTNIGLENVDFAAPGERIYSTVPDNKYKAFSGTSMSTPIATGIAAEILSRNPELTALELKEILLNSLTEISEEEKLIAFQGKIDLFKALQTKEIFISKL